MLFNNQIRYYIFLLLFVFCCAASAMAQGEVSYKIKEGYDRMFYNTNNPKIEFAVVNKSNYEGYNGELMCKVESFDGNSIYEFSQRFYVSTNDSAILGFSFRVDPGFYRIILEKEGQVLERAVMGYEPEKLFANATINTSAMHEWQQSLNSLANVPLDFEITKVKKTGGKLRNAYKVVYRSADNKVASGYLVIPKKNGVYPVVITCTDKDELLWIPDGNSNEERIDFVISPSRRILDDKYYYNICMDVIRAIDFIVQRKEADLKNIFLQGRGVGAALAIGAAALDSRVAAVAAYAPALSNNSAIDSEKDYDIKNLSRYVKCPVLMGVGLEDTICTPYMNFEIYNPIESVKEYYIFINDHSEPALWRELADNFYRKHGR